MDKQYNDIEKSFSYAKNAFNQEKEHRKLMEGRKELLLHQQRIEEYCKNNTSLLPKRSYKHYLNVLKSMWTGKLKIIRVDYVDANGSRKTGFWFTFDSNSWFFFPRLILPTYNWMK